MACSSCCRSAMDTTTGVEFVDGGDDDIGVAGLELPDDIGIGGAGDDWRSVSLELLAVEEIEAW
jgi:hypothetical protein